MTEHKAETGKERIIKALRREKIHGRVPHFELVFYLTMEVFGKVHPEHRSYRQWDQMSANEKKLHLRDMAGCYIAIAEKYHHDAIFVTQVTPDLEVMLRLLDTIREMSGDRYFLLIHGDPTFSIPDGGSMLDFTARLYEEPSRMKEISEKRTRQALESAARITERGGLLDGIGLCADYCFNVNPFFGPDLFAEFIAPYLKQVIDEYRKMGLYSIKHTDGNIIPILSQMVDCGPDALHSLDPQGGVDLKEVRKQCGNKVALMGNVNCGLLHTGTDEECDREIRRSLKDGMEDYGYIFSTSNCVYTGMPLHRYERMVDIWLEEGVYNGD